MIEKFEDLPPDAPQGYRVEVTPKTIRILMTKLNELIEAVNRQEEAIRYLADKVGGIEEVDKFWRVIGEVNSILSGKEKQ